MMVELERFWPETVRTRFSLLVDRSLRAAVAAASLAFVAGCNESPPETTTAYRTGLEVLAASEFAPLRGKRVGVVANPTAVDGELRGIVERLEGAPGVTLVCLFAPEHGAHGAEAAGKTIGDDAHSSRAALPIYSLYGETRRPSAEMLRGIDIVLFDIQDIGVRTYTYLATLKEVLAAAAENDVEVCVLDRPVPLGGRAEGPVLEPSFTSFVGPHSLPLRHGLTAGEFARLVNAEAGLGAPLRVIAMTGYERSAWSVGRGERPWIAPSPNIPDRETALVYAGMVLVEGTNVSEGRGTTRPFRLVGAPWIDADELAHEIRSLRPLGCRVRPALFRPWFSKYEGESCQGIEVYVLDPFRYRPVEFAVALLVALQRLYPGDFAIDAPRFDRLAGTASLRESIERGDSVETIAADWRTALAEYERRRRPHLLYPLEDEERR